MLYMHTGDAVWWMVVCRSLALWNVVVVVDVVVGIVVVAFCPRILTRGMTDIKRAGICCAALDMLRRDFCLTMLEGKRQAREQMGVQRIRSRRPSLPQGVPTIFNRRRTRNFVHHVVVHVIVAMVAVDIPIVCVPDDSAILRYCECILALALAVCGHIVHSWILCVLGEVAGVFLGSPRSSRAEHLLASAFFGNLAQGLGLVCGEASI